LVHERVAALLEERRPKRADAQRNFDALLESARTAFAEQGLEASLEDIARRADVGIGTLYRNFPTRDELVEAVYLGELAQMTDYAEEVAAREPGDAVEAWLRRFAAYAVAKQVLLEGLNRDSTVMRSCRGVLAEAGEPLLTAAQRAGAVRPDITMDDVIRLLAGLSRGAYADDEQRERVLALAIDGLRTR
jgi:AcrR family transcriptional regulator